MQTSEHVFGTLKAWMGATATHFLMKRLPNVPTEMSAYSGDAGPAFRWKPDHYSGPSRADEWR